MLGSRRMITAASRREEAGEPFFRQRSKNIPMGAGDSATRARPPRRLAAGSSKCRFFNGLLAVDDPRLVQRLILLGTGPRGGEGMTFTELSPEEQADPVAFLLGAFFSPSKASQAGGR